MAILTSDELTQIRNGVANTPGIVVNYTKPQLNAAAQKIEDFLAANAATVSAQIDTATSPLVLTNAVKKALVAYVSGVKYLRDK